MRKRTVVRRRRTVKNDSEPQAATAQGGVEISIMGAGVIRLSEDLFCSFLAMLL